MSTGVVWSRGLHLNLVVGANARGLYCHRHAYRGSRLRRRVGTDGLIVERWFIAESDTVVLL